MTPYWAGGRKEDPRACPARSHCSADPPGPTKAGIGVPSAPPGGSTTGTLYFDVVGDPPNSVVYNDGVQDLLVWVPGPLEGGTNTTGSGAPDVAGETTEIIGGPPAEGAAEAPPPEAAPEVIAPPPFQLTEPEVAEPGFNAVPGGGHR